MTTKAKRQLSAKINQILKENKFYRLGGRWNKDVPIRYKDREVLHIGVQPEGKFRPDFSNEDALKRFKTSLKQIKSLPNVQKTKAREFHFGWNSMAGIEIIF